MVMAVAVGSARVGLLKPLVGERTAHQLGTLAWTEPGLDRGRLIRLGIVRFRPLGRRPSLVSPAQRVALGAGAAADVAGRPAVAGGLRKAGGK